MIIDIAMLVLEKCTEERNDRDDVSFEMTFDYEFVEDFYVDRSTEHKTTPTNATNVVFNGTRSGSLQGRRNGDGEYGETAVVELREVKVMVDGERKSVKTDHVTNNDTDNSSTTAV